MTMMSGVSGTTNTSSLSDDPKLFNLLEKRKWRKVRRALKSPSGLQYSMETDSTRLSCLGIALGFKAPVDIIKLLLSVNPGLSTATDSYGATCLHIACLNGSSLDSIDFLLQTYPQLVTICDNDERIPLHHAVEFACQCNDDEDEGFYLELISTVFRAKPETIFYTDKEGDSALDLLQMFKTTCDSSEHQRLDGIYKLLRKFSVSEYLKKKRKWEDEGYDLSKVIDDGSKRTASTATSSLTNKTLGTMNSKVSKVSTIYAAKNDDVEMEEVFS